MDNLDDLLRRLDLVQAFFVKEGLGFDDKCIAVEEARDALDRAIELLRAVQNAKQKPGISQGEDSGSFYTILHGNWFICTADFLGE